MPPQAMRTADERYSSPPAFTPHTAPFSVSIFVTILFMTLTPSFFISRARASAMSLALSLTGNTLLPRSVFSGTPSSSKKLMVHSASKPANELYIKRGLTGIFFICSSEGLLLVTLQRPLPVMRSFLPSFSFFSKSSTVLPKRAAFTAAKQPAAPPPIIIVSVIVFLFYPCP